jgi:hypothetical protein
MCLKEKVTLTVGEMYQIETIKNLARNTDNPSLVKLYRLQMNSIINKAKRRNK